MKTYNCYNEQGIRIDRIIATFAIKTAKKHFRNTWSGYIKVCCEETNEQIISRN